MNPAIRQIVKNSNRHILGTMNNTIRENLAEFVRADGIFPLLEKVPSAIVHAYTKRWERCSGYPHKVRVDDFIIGLNNEINSTLYNLAGEFPKIRRHQKQNRTGVYTHTELTSGGIKLTASRVGLLSSSPRDAEYRKDIATATTGFLFEEPALELDNITYMQILHGWDEEKRYSLKPQFLRLRYVAGESGSITLDLCKLVGVDLKTLTKSAPIEVVVDEDNFQFKNIDSIGKAETA